MLVVDDDRGVRQALRLILDDTYEVLVAADGGAGLATVQSRRVDLVLLEILLPGVDGLEVLRELKAIDPALPVIIVTAVKTVRTTVMAMKLGACEYLTKPFDEEELRRAVEGALPRPRAVGLAGLGEERALSRHVARALDYLTTHYSSPLTVETVARAVGVSESHLAHLFRAELGTTVRAHLTQRRVEAAAQRLTRGDDKLAEVAQQVGFCDASHLARTFVRLTGRRPSSYRRAGRKGAGVGSRWIGLQLPNPNDSQSCLLTPQKTFNET